MLLRSAIRENCTIARSGRLQVLRLVSFRVRASSIELNFRVRELM